MISGIARIAATIVALLAWSGLIVQLDASIATQGSMAAALWGMFRFFTVISNLLVAVVFSGVALGWPAFSRPSWLGGVTLMIMLVGIVYALLLRGLLELSGGARLADFLLHSVTPLVAPLWWLLFAPKGRLNMRHPLLWAVLPVVYFLYAIGRGRVDGNYAYPFMNVEKLGWPQTMTNVGAIAVGFLLAGYMLVWLDRVMSRRRV